MNAAFLKALKAHPWKGNIRELKNVIERCIILAPGVLDPSILPADFNIEADADSLDLKAVEKKHIAKVLSSTAGNKTQAAKLLGIGLTTLYQKLKDYNL
ncbi:MAG: hypothetical protein HC859_06140 [Bacteroidia bacterium]|nr:hypothetical protein [Bacteroidia bacterium]